MYRIDTERIDRLLTEYEARREDKRYHPEEMVRRDPVFRAEFDRAVRRVVVPVLQEVASSLRSRLDSVSIFHRLSTAGLTVKLDPWEDFDRTLLFYGDADAGLVRVTHEGTGFALLCDKLPPSGLDEAKVEAEAMRFLDRVLHREPAGEAVAEGVADQPENGAGPEPARAPAGTRRPTPAPSPRG